jgi:ribosome-associated translation inhibitor RaiA
MAMRITVHAQGFELEPQLRGFAESRLWSSLSPLQSSIQLVTARLEIRTGEGDRQPTSCDVVVTLRPSGEVRARTGDVHMDVAIATASERIRAAVERAVSQAPGFVSPPAAHASSTEPLRIALNTEMSQYDRESIDGPENELRRRPAGEDWKPPGVDGVHV